MPNGVYWFMADVYPVDEMGCLMLCELNEEIVPGTWGCSEEFGDLPRIHFVHPSNCFYVYTLAFGGSTIDDETIREIINSIEFLEVPPGPTIS